jgi:hypothetical protein
VTLQNGRGMFAKDAIETAERATQSSLGDLRLVVDIAVAEITKGQASSVNIQSRNNTK